MTSGFTTLPLLFDARLADELFLLARLLFGAVLAFMGLNHFLDADAMTGYVEATGFPAVRFSVLLSGGMSLFGGLGVASGTFPALAAGALVVFLGVATPTTHTFWNAPDDRRQSELTDFLKNGGPLGAAIGLLALSTLE